MSRTGYSPWWRAIQANFTATLSQRTPRLFLRTRPPASAGQPPAAVAEVPAPVFLLRAGPPLLRPLGQPTRVAVSVEAPTLVRLDQSQLQPHDVPPTTELLQP